MLLLSVISPSRGGALILICSSCRSSRDGPGADTVCAAPGCGNSSFFHSQPRRPSPGYHEAGGQGLPPPSPGPRPTPTQRLEVLLAEPRHLLDPHLLPGWRSRCPSARRTFLGHMGVLTHTHTHAPSRTRTRPSCARLASEGGDKLTPGEAARPGRRGEAGPGLRVGSGRAGVKVGPRRPAGLPPLTARPPPAHVPGDRPPIGSIPATGSE